MTIHDIRNKFLEYERRHDHAVIPSASLVPEADPTTLFTGSGMQPLIPYLLGQPHPLGKRLANSQKSFRSQDIEEVGDNRHTTFFEMLGNWSLGDYFKEEQLPWFFRFLTEEIGLDPKLLYVTVFSGDEKNGIPKDEDSVAIWKRLFREKGIEAADLDFGTEERAAEQGMQGARIFAYGAKKNWWSRSGVPENMPAGEPGGPDSEVFFEFEHIEHNPAFGKECHPNCDCGRFLEIGNSVFMEYQKQEDESFVKLAQRNVDFGGGLERIAAAFNNDADVFKTDAFSRLIRMLEEKTGKAYLSSPENTRAFRIIADHLKAAVFIIGDGIAPSNTDQGYIVRRLIRRAVRFADQLGVGQQMLSSLALPVIETYQAAYPELAEQQNAIQQEIQQEEERFRKTLMRGLKELEKGTDAFTLFTTYGFPFELTKEIASERGIAVDEEVFLQKMQEHQERSRTATAGKFKGGLADASYETTKLHTAHHLLLAALRQVLGEHVHQRGSNITAERLRLDFSHPQKMTAEELKTVEDLVNRKIGEKLDMVRKEMPKEEALMIGAEMEFGVKYGDMVSVYVAQGQQGEAFSKEFCGGPHVANTEELGRFKILKEEAVSSGVRRIKAVLE